MIITRKNENEVDDDRIKPNNEIDEHFDRNKTKPRRSMEIMIDVFVDLNSVIHHHGNAGKRLLDSENVDHNPRDDYRNSRDLVTFNSMNLIGLKRPLFNRWLLINEGR